MDEGRIVADGPAGEILAQRELLDRLGLRHPRLTTDMPCPACANPATGEPAASLVELQGIVAGYGRREVLSGVELALYAGEFAALVGDNGAGKTTLVRLLAGILRPRKGRIRWSPQVRRLPLAERVGMLFQNPAHQLVCDRVADEVAYGLDNLRRPGEARLESLLAAADLSLLRDRSPQSLSAGQQQRTALVADVSLSPKLLILDEPTLGQDWGHLSRLMDYLQQLNGQGQAILLITHDEKLVHRYAQRIIRMEKGRVVGETR
jgi:energy-coupling factor transport system ATP-binding protein